MAAPRPAIRKAAAPLPDLRDVKGQESAKRALEIAAAGGHNLLFNGPPGAGKSMLAARLPSILPPLTPRELLEVSLIHSIAGDLAGGALTDRRPFRAPHHSASTAALVGGGTRARPGEISLAHHGVLFLDELPEFHPQVLDSLRQPIETGEVAIARANHRVTYPARFQLVAAMNPCRCGHANDPDYACSRQPNARCIGQYQSRISGPLLDRIDLHVEAPAVAAADLMLPRPSEGSIEVAERVAAARAIQVRRYAELGLGGVGSNAAAPAAVIEVVAQPDAAGRTLVQEASDGLHPLRIGARISPHFEARAHHRGSRRSQHRREPSSGRSIVLPHRRQPPIARRLSRHSSVDRMEKFLFEKASPQVAASPIWVKRRLRFIDKHRLWAVSLARHNGPAARLRSRV